jgi:hypothetical protein
MTDWGFKVCNLWAMSYCSTTTQSKFRFNLKAISNIVLSQKKKKIIIIIKPHINCLT